MKKINILPMAEKEIDFSKLMAQVRKESGIAVPMLVYFILFAVIFVIGLIKPLLSLPLIGILFILPGIDSSGTIYQNGREVKNNARNRLPLLLLGIFVTLFGICGSISMYDKSIAGFAAKIVLALMIVTIASIIIVRLINLIVLSAAAANRKNSCTCPVPYEHDDYAPDGTNIYKYYYEGECYHFMDHDGSVFAESTGLDNMIMIDPDSPERYYLKSEFGHYGKSLRKLIKKLIIFIVLIISPLWIFMILKYILDLDAHLEYILDLFS
jgi:hypothetical protein